MKIPRFVFQPRLLGSLLAVSLGVNFWLWLRPVESVAAPQGARKFVPKIAEWAAQGKSAPQSPEDPGLEMEGKEITEGRKPAEPGVQNLSMDEIIYGTAGKAGEAPIQSAPRGKISPQRLKEIAEANPSEAERFRVKIRLLLAGDQVLDLGESEVAPGQLLKLERIKEFPFPTSLQFAQINLQSAKETTSFPVTPTTPVAFEMRNTGLEIELDVNPAGGALVVGGSVNHRVFEGFGQMPGEAFSTITDTTAGGGEIVLSDNKVLQPQFTARESPFVAAAAAGQACLVPVRLASGPAFLEVTCSPVE